MRRPRPKRKLIRFRHRACRSLLGAKLELAGRQMTCPRCGDPVLVPGSDPAIPLEQRRQVLGDLDPHWATYAPDSAPLEELVPSATMRWIWGWVGFGALLSFSGLVMMALEAHGLSRGVERGHTLASLGVLTIVVARAYLGWRVR